MTLPAGHTDIATWAPNSKLLPAPEHLDKLGIGTFTAIDLETTGIDPDAERVIEWGAARFVDGRLEGAFRTFVDPGKSLPVEITALTGITDQDLIGAPDFADTYHRFRQFWEPSPVVGHHVDFDLGFLKSSMKRSVPEAGDFLFKGRPIYDTAELARALLPSETGYGLGALVRSRNIQRTRAHRALEDAVATGWLFLMLAKEALELDFQTVATQLRFLEGGRHYIQRFLARLGNMLTTQELTRGIRSTSVVPVPEGMGVEEETLPRQAPPWREVDYERIFGEGGEIARAFPGFEERPQQATMAVAVYKAFRESRFLSVEAGTGTGKSLAYLAPALAWACANPSEKRRVVVSTGTKNLQEQLFNKDLPDLRLSLPFRFRTALLKGRSNYLCLSRWKSVLADPAFRLTPEERVAALPLIRWVQETRTGDLSEVSAIRGNLVSVLKSKLASDSGMCPGNSCKESKGCFLQRARRRAQSAHVVVVNHALLFSDVSSDGSVLGEYDRLIVDEAHRLEKAAVSHLGIEWNEAILFRPLNRLYQGGRVERGILTLITQKLGKPDDPLLKRLATEIQTVADQVVLLGEYGREFLQKFIDKVDRAGSDDDGNGFPVKKRYRKGQSPIDSLKQLAGTIAIHYRGLINSLTRFLELRNEVEGRFPFYNDEISGELSSAKDDLTRDRENFQFLSDCDDPNWVTWYEISGSMERRWVKFQAAPLDVSGLIHDALWKRVKTAVMTSATLAVGNSFGHFERMVGLERIPEERRDAMLLGSPFNLDKQMAILVPKYLPSPKNTAQYLEEVSHLVKQIAATKRGTLVLFTSYQALNQVASSIRAFLEQKGVTLLIQGRDGAPELLLKRFRDDRSSILLGTDSFWEGIDVVGEALEVLIVTRLPFDVPTDPWIEARTEQITAQGGNAFMEFSVPEAVIRLRQGVGRLIRTRKDRGVVLVADSRIISTRFGRVFTDALPTTTETVQNRDQLAQRFARFWSG